MIARVSLSGSQLAVGTLPVAMEHLVRCRADVGFTVGAIMSAMERYPFAASDGFAVQLAVSEALENVLEPAHVRNEGTEVRVRTHVTSQFIRIQIEDVGTGTETGAGRPSDLTGLSNRNELHMMRTYMTSVEFRKQGRQVILYRARGQGSAISGPPIGYDFQI